MLELLRETGPGADIRQGSAEGIPVETGSVDAVYASESFHWFDGARAIPEIERALRPLGILVLTWNVPGGPTEPSTAKAERLLEDAAPPRGELGYDPVDLNGMRFSSGAWREPFANSGFEELREQVRALLTADGYPLVVAIGTKTETATGGSASTPPTPTASRSRPPGRPARAGA